ncbi:MAG TPA: MFS transporter, partial [Tepidiformaceae bacterium]|nr:MFS transporter [Tepidiformaceae bacterium]
MSASPALGERLTNRQKVLIYVSLMITMFVSALDQSIVATATPRILADLGGFALLSWVFTVYLLASTVVVPLVGKLSDMFGRKPFIIGGITIFVGASVGCGLAPSMPALIAARAVQGVGGGLLFGSVFATLGDIFTPIQRARYMGYFISAFTLASLSGPTIGGFLTDGPGWRWCFYINLPVGIVAATLIWVNLPMSRQGGRLRDIDFQGALLLGA